MSLTLTVCMQVYELYADYALKNPFYSLEMPIREGRGNWILFQDFANWDPETIGTWTLKACKQTNKTKFLLFKAGKP